ncbi:MAG: hypothetical protein COT15_05160 [Candidatus Diapherotrites archaeon CG08_land_8_20_14_0_20_34_12]|nr:MAG: hypothetical protein COT15_05160 [Candidatus Diapherotrites archaeon CG08_land_8_20_14_0_20_34_12]
MAPRPQRSRRIAAKAWSKRGFARISELRRRTAVTRIPFRKKLQFLRQVRAEELRAVIPDLSEAEAARLLSKANETLLLNGNSFKALLVKFSDLIEPHELRPEHFSIRNVVELVDLCNRRPELRYAKFFKVDPNQRAEATMNGGNYRGHAVSISNGKVTVEFDNFLRPSDTYSRGHITERIRPFRRVFSFRDKSLIRVKEGKRSGNPRHIESLEDLVLPSS